MLAVNIYEPMTVVHADQHIQIIPDDRAFQRVTVTGMIESTVIDLLRQINVSVSGDIALVEFLTVEPERAFTALLKVDFAFFEQRLDLKIDVIGFIFAEIHKLNLFGVGLAVVHALNAEEVFACGGIDGIAVRIHRSQLLRKPLHRAVGQSDLRKSRETIAGKKQETARKSGQKSFHAHLAVSLPLGFSY